MIQVVTPIVDMGPVFTREGWGVRAGKPLGMAQINHDRALNSRYRFQPQAASALRAATRSALRW